MIKTMFLWPCIAGLVASSAFAAGPDRKVIDDPRYSAAINAAWQKQNRSASYQQAVLTEDESIRDASADQVRAARRWYGDMPLIVLASTRTTKLYPNETRENREALNRVHDYLEDQMAALSKRGVLRVVPNSTHDIQMSQPDAVSAAILEVLQTATSGK